MILRLYGPLEPWFDKAWKAGGIELVKSYRRPLSAGCSRRRCRAAAEPGPSSVCFLNSAASGQGRSLPKGFVHHSAGPGHYLPSAPSEADAGYDRMQGGADSAYPGAHRTPLSRAAVGGNGGDDRRGERR